MDSANKTFFIMVVLTMVCFGITLYQFFNPATNNTEQTSSEESTVYQTEEIKKVQVKNNFSLSREVVTNTEDIILPNANSIDG